MEKKIKLTYSSFLSLLVLLVGISICTRSFYFRIYGSHIIEFAILLTLCIINIFGYLQSKKNINIVIIPTLLSIFIFFNFIGFDSKNTINLIFYIICLSLFFCINDKPEVLIILIKTIIVFAIITSTVTWISYFFPDFYLKYIINIFSDETKLEVIRYFTKNGHYLGLTNHYSRNAFYIVSGLIFLTPVILSKNYSKKYYILYAYLLLTLLLIGKRGHALFFIISFYIMIIFNEKSSKKRIKNIFKWTLILLTSFILTLIFIPQTNTLLQRLAQSSGDITTGRTDLYEIAVEMFKKEPIIGNGYGSFARMMNFKFAGVHNDYLQILSEGGIVGLILMLGFNLSCYIYSIKAIKITNYENIYAKMSFMFQTFILIYSFTGLPRYDYEVMTLYFIMCAWGVEIFRINYVKKGF